MQHSACYSTIVEREIEHDSGLWCIHGLTYSIPPLFDQLPFDFPHSTRPSAYAYAEWARSMHSGLHTRPQTHGTRNVPLPNTRRERGDSKKASERNFRDLPQQCMDGQGAADSVSLPSGCFEGGLERWRRSWSVVVRRDILRQQRAIVTQQREMLVSLKRSVLAVQKEVRKRALRAQRLASNPQVQIRCKRIARDVAALASHVDAQQQERREAAALKFFFRVDD